MKYTLFSGCVIPQKENAYELSVKKVSEKLGIELIELKNANCCGYFLNFIDNFSSIVLAARNLSLAEETGNDLVTLCNGCFGHLTRVNYELSSEVLIEFDVDDYTNLIEHTKDLLRYWYNKKVEKIIVCDPDPAVLSTLHRSRLPSAR